MYVKRNWNNIIEESRSKWEKDIYYLLFVAQTGILNLFLLVWESSINWTIFGENSRA